MTSSFMRYPGGKSKLKKRIIEKLNEFEKSEYREPFFGGGSIGLEFLSKRSPTKIWLNDKDIGIFCLWHSVIHEHEKLKNLVMSFVPTKEDFYKFKNELLSCESPVDKVYCGFSKLAIHQISYSGLGTKSGGPLGGKEQKSQYKIDCRWSPKYICSKIDKLHSLFDKFELRLTSCDFEWLITDTSESMIYLDPPYYVKGNELYQCAFTENDHIRLANLLQSTNHTWILSYDDCPEIRELYRWAKIEELSVNYSIAGARKKSELLICK